VGGGAVAERKVLALLRAGAKVTVVSPTLTVGLTRKVRSGELVHRARGYRKGDLRGVFLVIAATSDEAVNRRVHGEAPCLVNIVDRPEYGNFIVPSSLRRGPLTLAVSTSGRSPALARSIRQELEALYGEEFRSLLRCLEVVRREVKERVKSPTERSRLLKEIASPEILSVLRTEGPDEAKRMVRVIAGSRMGEARES
jgi:precorrin-2 dehydrogenase/sirohydrochlorin ferrochelatase